MAPVEDIEEEYLPGAVHEIMDGSGLDCKSLPQNIVVLNRESAVPMAAALRLDTKRLEQNFMVGSDMHETQRAPYIEQPVDERKLGSIKQFMHSIVKCFGRSSGKGLSGSHSSRRGEQPTSIVPIAGGTSDELAVRHQAAVENLPAVTGSPIMPFAVSDEVEGTRASVRETIIDLTTSSQQTSCILEVEHLL